MRQRSISQISSASGVSAGSQGHDEADGIPDDVSVASSQQGKAVLSRKQRRFVHMESDFRWKVYICIKDPLLDGDWILEFIMTRELLFS